MWVAGPELARSPGHRFYEKLNELLSEAKFDRVMERICAPYFEVDDTAIPITFLGRAGTWFRATSALNRIARPTSNLPRQEEIRSEGEEGRKE